MRSYVVRGAGGGIGVDDAVADTFLVAWRRLDEVPEPARPWLLGVARRVLADQRRGLRRRRSLSDRLALASSSRMSWEPPAGVSAELAGALRELTGHEREALMLVASPGRIRRPQASRAPSTRRYSPGCACQSTSRRR